MLRGGFWNTMVMVFKLKTLLEYLRTISPVTYRGFEKIYRAVGSANFEKVVKQVFAQAQPFNLSTGFLETLPVQRGHNLLVLPVRGVHWSDWGSEARIMKTLEHAENGSYDLESSSALFNSLFRRSVAGST
jgi:mannose-1-phosphate guanylyltransferase